MSELVRIAVRMYQVGFGDCFLASFEYDGPLADGRSERHMLIDFGRNHKPHYGGDLREVARSISERTHKVLDVIVVTHRHEDHLSAFGSKAVAAILDACQPRLVVRPWTENPELDKDAGRPAHEADRRYVAGIAGARSFTGEFSGGFALDRTAAGQKLRAAAQTEVANKQAIDQLDTWANRGAFAYVSAGTPSRIDEFIPGIGVEVLGPPLPSVAPSIEEQANDHPEEFWHLWQQRVTTALAGARSAEAAAGDGTGRGATRLRASAAPHATGTTIGPERWLTDKIRRQQLGSLLRIVRWLDDVMNNTSVVLLITAGDRRLLFPGDAQLESWRWILHDSPDADRHRTELGKVDLYKVGHHGSRNATPKLSLYRLWQPENGSGRDVISLLSTREDAYGESDDTDVPNPKLVAGLSASPLRLLTTLQTKGDDGRLATEVAAPAFGDARFEEQPPIPRRLKGG